jgi:hypothetical protein
MKKIILNEEDIKSLENFIGNLPTFAKTVNETMSVSQAVQNLMQFLGTKIVEQDEAEQSRD